jgi:hypothetical protein
MVLPSEVLGPDDRIETTQRPDAHGEMQSAVQVTPVMRAGYTPSKKTDL